MKPISTNITFLICALAFSSLLISTCKAGDGENGTAYKLELSFFKADSVNTVKALLTSNDSSNVSKPVAKTEVKFYAKKSFGLLPIGEPQTTDENGEATVAFPIDLPGDSTGNVEVIAKVEDNEELGDLENMKPVKWGIPTSSINAFHDRALWGTAANAPLPLVITATSIVIVVWGVIFYIVTLLYKIPKS